MSYDYSFRFRPTPTTTKKTQQNNQETHTHKMKTVRFGTSTVCGLICLVYQCDINESSDL